MNSSCVSPILESYNGKDLKKAKVARHEHFPFGRSPTGFVLPMKFTGSLKKMKFTGTSLGERMLWKPTTLCKLWKLQSIPLDDHPMDRSGGGTILHVTPAARLVTTRRCRRVLAGRRRPGRLPPYRASRVVLRLAWSPCLVGGVSTMVAGG